MASAGALASGDALRSNRPRLRDPGLRGCVVCLHEPPRSRSQGSGPGQGLEKPGYSFVLSGAGRHMPHASTNLPNAQVPPEARAEGYWSSGGGGDVVWDVGYSLIQDTWEH